MLSFHPPKPRPFIYSSCFLTHRPQCWEHKSLLADVNIFVNLVFLKRGYVECVRVCARMIYIYSIYEYIILTIIQPWSSRLMWQCVGRVVCSTSMFYKGRGGKWAGAINWELATSAVTFLCWRKKSTTSFVSYPSHISTTDINTCPVDRSLMWRLTFDLPKGVSLLFQWSEVTTKTYIFCHKCACRLVFFFVVIFLFGIWVWDGQPVQIHSPEIPPSTKCQYICGGWVIPHIACYPFVIMITEYVRLLISLWYNCDDLHRSILHKKRKRDVFWRNIYIYFVVFEVKVGFQTQEHVHSVVSSRYHACSFFNVRSAGQFLHSVIKYTAYIYGCRSTDLQHIIHVQWQHKPSHPLCGDASESFMQSFHDGGGKASWQMS